MIAELLKRPAKLPYLIALLMIVCSNSAWADEESGKQVLPRGCQAINFQFKGKALLLGKAGDTTQRIFLITNYLSSTALLNHTKAVFPNDTDWNSQLYQARWTAIAVNHGQYLLTCLEVQPGAEQYIPCSKTLHVCELTTAKFSENSIGSYLVAVDKKQDDILYEIKQRGISIL